MKQKRSLDQVGLRLSRHALRVLKDRGIFAYSPVSLEHQHLAKRYVVRGVESGGAVGDIGRYGTFTQEDGQPIKCLHPVEAIGVNAANRAARHCQYPMIRFRWVEVLRGFLTKFACLTAASRADLTSGTWISQRRLYSRAPPRIGRPSLVGYNCSDYRAFSTEGTFTSGTSRMATPIPFSLGSFIVYLMPVCRGGLQRRYFVSPEVLFIRPASVYVSLTRVHAVRTTACICCCPYLRCTFRAPARQRGRR